MRITYIHQYFTTPDRPGGTRSYDFARRLVRAGHEVNVVTSATDGRGERGWFVSEHDGVVVHWIPIPYANAMSYRQRLWAFARFLVAASVRAAKLQSDVVFATSTPLTVAIPAVIAARWRRVPMVFEVRDLWPAVPIAIGALDHGLLAWMARMLERWAYRNAESVVALSPGIREGIAATGYPEERVAVIPNGSDLDVFKPDREAATAFRSARPWLGDRPLLLYAGAIGRVNGVVWLVDLVQELSKRIPEIRALVIGDGYERESVAEAARAAGILGRVFFMEPRVAKSEIAAAFAAANLAASLFIPEKTLETGSPNKLFDSLACGTPALINYGGWQAALLEDRGAGVVSNHEPIDLAAARVARLLESPDEARLSGQRARALATELFDVEKNANTLRELLVAAVNRRGDTAWEKTKAWESYYGPDSPGVFSGQSREGN